MKYLLDTHLGVWSLTQSHRLGTHARGLVEDQANQSFISVISIWEVAIKHALRRPDFDIDPSVLRRTLGEAGFLELPVNGDHAVAVRNLPSIHKDPFDRLLVAQAMVEGMTLLTVDRVLASYPCPVRLV